MKQIVCEEASSLLATQCSLLIFRVPISLLSYSQEPAIDPFLERNRYIRHSFTLFIYYQFSNCSPI
jgi:hypothetical protein